MKYSLTKILKDNEDGSCEVPNKRLREDSTEGYSTKMRMLHSGQGTVRCVGEANEDMEDHKATDPPKSRHSTPKLSPKEVEHIITMAVRWHDLYTPYRREISQIFIQTSRTTTLTHSFQSKGEVIRASKVYSNDGIFCRLASLWGSSAVGRSRNCWHLPRHGLRTNILNLKLIGKIC